MVAFRIDETEAPQVAAVRRCEGCGCVHVRAKDTLLTFTTTEFAAFADSVNDCYRRKALLNSLDDHGPRLGVLRPIGR
jgi:hypothetical protein